MSPRTYRSAVDCIKAWVAGTPVKQIERERCMGKGTFYVMKQRFSRKFPDVFRQLLENVRNNNLRN